MAICGEGPAGCTTGYDREDQIAIRERGEKLRASISRIKAFKACRREWYFKYHEHLVPIQMPDALATGRAYHERLEALENGDPLGPDFTKESAMAAAYEKYIFPKFKVIAAEAELERHIGNHILHGIVDGLSEDGFIVEHKTTSRDISEGGEYEYNLLWDEQVLAYMALTGRLKVYYTVCRKPTIRQKRDESDEDFYNRMVAWYDEDTDQKIRVFVVERTDEEVDQFERDFVDICDEMEQAEHSERYYRNTCHCMQYGRRCEYASVCLHYDPAQDYVEFQKIEEDN